jgi:hypothetical protein
VQELSGSEACETKYRSTRETDAQKLQKLPTFAFQKNYVRCRTPKFRFAAHYGCATAAHACVIGVLAAASRSGQHYLQFKCGFIRLFAESQRQISVFYISWVWLNIFTSTRQEFNITSAINGYIRGTPDPICLSAASSLRTAPYIAKNSLIPVMRTSGPFFRVLRSQTP